MANQAIALQARAPQQGNFLAPAIQQAGQMANRMAQQQALDRQTATAEQALEVSRAGEARAAAKAPFELAEAKAKALTAEQKNTVDFFDLVATGVKNSSTPDQVMVISDFLKQKYPGAIQQIDQKLSDMPSDPAAFDAWREKTMLQSLETKDQLTNEFTTQNLGTSTRVLRTPKFGGGAGEVVPGSEAAVTIKPTVVNVEGMGAIIVDPNTGQGYPVAAGATGGYRPPAPAGGLVGGPRGGAMPTAPMAPPTGAATPVATALQTNPGAIKDSPYARSQPGYAGSSGGFATFDTPQAGIAAQENLLSKDYVGKGINTIDKIISRYSPPGRENAPAAVANYKNYVAQRAGIDVNAPITAAQVPAVAAAMREFETGVRPGGKTPVPRGAAAAPAAAPKTIEEAATQKAFGKVLPIIGYNPKTGASRVEDLIKASTSGQAEMIGSEIMGAVTGKGTPGREALGELSAIAENMTFEKLRGKLGAQISDADVRLIARTMADIANANTPANVRATAWKNVVLPGLLRGAGVEPKTPTAPAGLQTRAASATAPPTAAIQMLRRNPTPAERKLFDSVFGVGASAKALGGR